MFPIITKRYPELQYDEYRLNDLFNSNCYEITIRCATIVDNMEYYQLYKYNNFNDIDKYKNRIMIMQRMKERIIESANNYLDFDKINLNLVNIENSDKDLDNAIKLLSENYKNINQDDKYVNDISDYIDKHSKITDDDNKIEYKK
jgi:hypothetical protein